MNTCESRVIYRGGGPVKLGVVVTLDPDNPDNEGVVLDQQGIKIGFDQENWIDAEWVGSIGTSRVARIELAESDFPDGTVSVYYVLTDDSEAPVEYAGSLTVL